MPINPNSDPRINSLAYFAAQQANRKELDEKKGVDKKNEVAQKSTSKPDGKATPPQVEVNPYEAAIVKTMNLGIKAATTFTDLLYKEGQQVADKEAANLTPKQKQTMQTASTASAPAVRKGLDAAAANQIAKKVFEKFKDNENMDKDAIAVAALLIEDSMGSSV